MGMGAHAAGHIAAAGQRGGVNGRAGGAGAESIVGYIPDDVSSVHSSALGGGPGGGAALPTHASAYPPMFQGFQETWPQLPPGVAGGRNGAAGVGRPHTASATPESVAGESTADSQVTELTTGKNGGPGQGGVSLTGLSISDLNKQASLSQSDKLRRYVEGQQAPQPPIGAGRVTVNRSALEDNEDARSISTSFASQVGGVGGYD